jgi:hypothetical protein
MSINMGMGMGVNKGQQYLYCAEAQAYFAKMTTQPSVAQKAAYNTLISGMIAQGIYSKLVVCYIMNSYCSATDKLDSLKNLISTSYNGTPSTNCIYTQKAGWRSSNIATDYIDTGYTPDANKRNDASLIIWSNTDKTETTIATLGGAGDYPTLYFRHARFDANAKTLIGRINQDGTSVLVDSTNSDTRGLFGVYRTSSTACSLKVRKNAAITGSVASVAIGTETTYLMGKHQVDLMTFGCTHELGFYAEGYAITSAQHDSLSDLLTTFFAALAAA